VVGATELASTAVSEGDYGNATQVAQITVDADGRLTSASNVSISFPAEDDPEVGDLADNVVPYWNGTTLINGTMYDVGGNVGIGTTAPERLLSVGTAPSSGLYITRAGNAGVGTTAPAYELDVTGDIRSTGTIYGDLAGNLTGGYAAAGWVDDGGVVRLETDADNVGIGLTNPDAKLQVNGTINATAMNIGTDAVLTEASNLNASLINAGTIPAAHLGTASGDVTGPWSNLQITTDSVGETELVDTAVTAGDYGNATQVAQITVDADGRLTSASNVSISFPAEDDPEVGELADNVVPYWNGTTLINGTMYDVGGNVGIGTTSPLEAVHITAGSLRQDSAVAPVVVGSVYNATTLAGPYSVHVSGRYAYVALWDIARFTVVDVSDASNPEVVSSLVDSRFDYTGNVYVSGRYAYVTAYGGDELIVVDVSNVSNPEVTGSVSNNTTLNASDGLYVSGRYAYVAAYDADRLTVVDVSNASDPEIVGSVYNDTTLNEVSPVYVSGRYAYVVADDWLTVVDVSNASNPEIVGSVYNTTAFYTSWAVQVSGRYAYVTSRYGDRLTVVDVSNVSSPEIVGSVYNNTTLNGSTSVYVSGRYAYVTARDGDRLTIVEIPAIDAPAASIGDIAASSIEVSESVDVGGELHVRGGIGAGSGGIRSDGEVSVGENLTVHGQIVSTVPSGVPALNISSNTVIPNLNADLCDGVNCASLDQSDSNELQSLYNNITADNGSATALSQSSTLIVTGAGGITTGITEGGAQDTLVINASGLGGEDGDWDSSGTDLYLNATYANVGIGISAPSAVLDIRGAGSDSGFSLRIADSAATDRLVVLDNGNVGIGTTSPLATVHITAGSLRQDSAVDPVVVGSVSNATALNGAQSVYVSGGYVYIAAEEGDRLTVVDVSNASNPQVAGSVYNATGLNGARSLHVSGRYAYVAAWEGERLTVVDVGNASSPEIVGSVYNTTALNGASSVYVSGRYAYVAAWGGDRLTVVDVSDVTDPQVAGSVYNTTTLYGAEGVYVSGRYAYVAVKGGDRLTVVDVSNADTPEIVGSVYNDTTLNESVSLHVSGRYAYVAVKVGDRLTIVEIPAIDAPAASIGDIAASSIEVSESVDVGGELHVRGGIGAGSGG
ncbi:MAG: hypothetical protein MJA29_12260, partial [Candidatus Omnitrophica bacterium]|nr:hypothetical protein [Candidatus Omnitrophota bacterium]